MSEFLIETKGGSSYQLTVSSNMKLTASSNITEHAVESGATSTDHVINKNLDYNLSGLISNIKRLDAGSARFGIPTSLRSISEGQKDVEDYLNGILYTLRDSKEFFTVYFDDRMTPLSNCLLSNFSISRDSATGKAYKVDMKIKQVRVSARAAKVEINNQLNPDLTGSSSTGANTATEAVSTDDKSLFGDAVSGVFGG